MSLRRRKGSPFWNYRFTHKGVAYQESTGTTDKREAERIERKARAEVEAGKGAVVRGFTFRKMANLAMAFAEHKQKNTPKVLEDKQKMWDLMAKLIEGGEDVNPAKLEYKHFDALFLKLASAPYGNEKKGYLGQTLVRFRSLLKCGYEEASKYKEVGAIPLLPKFHTDDASKRAGRALDEEALTKWLAILKARGEATYIGRDGMERPVRNRSPDAYTQALMLALTGMRVSEMRNLDSTWVQGDELHIVCAKTRSGKRRIRVWPIHPIAAELLEKQIAKKGIAVPLWSGDHKTVFRKAAEVAGLESIAPRDLRHTVATMTAKHGSEKTTQQLLGHTTTKMTRRYIHASREACVAVVAEIAPRVASGK